MTRYPDPTEDTKSRSDSIKMLFEMARYLSETTALCKLHADILDDQIQSFSRKSLTLTGKETSLYPTGEISPGFYESSGGRDDGKAQNQYPKISLFLVHPDLKTVTSLFSRYAQAGCFMVYPFLHLQHLIPAITAETDGVIFLSATDAQPGCRDRVTEIRHTNPYIPIIILTAWEESGMTNDTLYDWMDGTVCEQDTTADVIRTILNAFETVALRNSGMENPDNPSRIMQGSI